MDSQTKKAVTMLAVFVVLALALVPTLIWAVLNVPPESLNVPYYTVYLFWLLGMALVGMGWTGYQLLKDIGS